MKKILHTLVLTTFLATPSHLLASDITELDEGNHHGAPKAAFHLPSHDKVKQDFEAIGQVIHKIIMKIVALFENNPDLLTEITDLFPNTKEANAIKGLLQTADPELKKVLKLYQKASDPSTRVAALKELTSTATDLFLKKLPTISGQYAWLNKYLNKENLEIFQNDMWQIWKNNNQNTSKVLEAFGKNAVNLFISHSVPVAKDILANHTNLLSDNDYSQIWALFKGVSSHTHDFKGIISTIEGIAQQNLEKLTAAPAVVEPAVEEIVAEEVAAPAAETVVAEAPAEEVVVESTEPAIAADAPAAVEPAVDEVAAPTAETVVAEPAAPVVEAAAEAAADEVTTSAVEAVVEVQPAV